MMVHDSMVHIWVLSWGVISPDNHILHMVRGHANTYRHLQAWRNTAGEQRALYVQYVPTMSSLKSAHCLGLWTTPEYVTRYGCSRTKLDVDDGQYIAWLPAALESTKIELETSIKQNEKWRWMRRWGSDLRAGPVMVQTGQAGEVLLRNGGSRFGGDQTVGVGWVSNN